MPQKAIGQSDVKADIDVETAIDLLYGPLYYRLQIATGSISDAYVDKLFKQRDGLTPEMRCFA